MDSNQVGVFDTDDVNKVFKIFEILEHILTFCKVEDLKSCRLVSKFWNDSAMKALQISAWVWISEKEKCIKFQKFIEPENTQGKALLYSNFKITGGHDHFWGICSPNIQRLNIIDCHLETTADIRQAIFHCCANLRQLKLQRLSTNRKYDPNKITGLPIEFQENKSLVSLHVDDTLKYFVSWNEIFHRFPYIEKFKLEGFGRLSDEECREIFTIIAGIRQADAKKLQLKKLDINLGIKRHYYEPSITPAVFDVLIDENLNLQKLKIFVTNQDNGAAKLNKILCIHRGSLRKLKLHLTGKKFLDADVCFSFPAGSQLPPVFDNLTELDLVDNVFESFDFLKYTPNLKSLSMSTWWGKPTTMVKKTNLFDMDNVRLERCKKLHLEMDLTTEELKMIIKWFPNVEHLRNLVLDNATFALVCQGWPNLVNFIIFRGRVDECAVTGLEPDQVNFINRTKENYSWRPATAPRANITAMKHLRYLSIDNWQSFESPYSELKHCSIHFGFLELPSIEKLYISKLMMSQENADRLLNSFRARYKHKAVRKSTTHQNYEITLAT